MSEKVCARCDGSGKCLRWPQRQHLGYGVLHVVQVVVIGGIFFALFLIRCELLLLAPEPADRLGTRFSPFASEGYWESVSWCLGGLVGSVGLWIRCWFTNPDHRIRCLDCQGTGVLRQSD